MPELELGPVPNGSATLRGYLARPDGDGPWPGVVSIHEAFGLNDQMRRHADRLAAAGYLTLAPDLFSDGGVARCMVSTVAAVMRGQGARFDAVLADIDAARAHLAGHADCTGKVGVIGFCMGGGFALVVANRGYAAAAPNYGPLPRPLRPALAGACPMVASYGGKDVSMRGAADKLAGALHDLGVEHDVKEYPDAGHAFLNDEFFGPGMTHAVQRIVHLGPEPAAAKDAWTRIEDFFRQHLSTEAP